MTLLFLDTETGGIPEDMSILSLSLKAYRFGTTRIFPVDELTLLVRPDDGVYKLQPQALAVNRIDLQQHKAESVSYTSATNLITSFLQKLNRGEKNRPVLCGQKVDYDLRGLFYHKILTEEVWRKLVDVKPIDTLAVAKFGVLCGLIPESQSLSLTNLAKFLEIEVNEDRLHTADYDNELTAQVLFSLRGLFVPQVVEKPKKKVIK